MCVPLTILAIAGLLGADAVPAPKATRLVLRVDGVARVAIVHVPPAAKRVATPVIFAFHAHGRDAGNAAVDFGFQKLWPDAISVYMQGSPTISGADPAGQKFGWQHNAGEDGDQDLKFFDATLARLRDDYLVDDRRIYATGHSNGGEFVYLLWATRGETFAAVAPSATAAGNRFIHSLRPKAAMHIAGANDQTVPIVRQRQLMRAIRKLNGCQTQGKPWRRVGTVYPSPGKTPFVELVHQGGHELWGRAPALIVDFFQRHARE
jgi:polyhydroxybutyrate depolymerase